MQAFAAVLVEDEQRDAEVFVGSKAAELRM